MQQPNDHSDTHYQVAAKGSARNAAEAIIAVHQPSGKVVGAVHVWPMGSHCAAIGMLVVHTAHQCQGLARCAAAAGPS